MFGLHWLDWIMLLIYILGITALGVWAKTRVRTLEDFFMGGRRFGKAMMMMHTFGTGTHTDQAVGVIGKIYASGLSGIWYQWLWLLSSPFYWILAPVFRRMRCLTIADFFQKRFGNSVAILYVVVGMVMLMVDIGIMLNGTARTVDSMTGGIINFYTTIILSTVLFVTYGIAGGLVAAILTDFIQGILIILLSVLLIPFALVKIGGMSGLHMTLHPESFSLISPQGITFFYIAMLSVNALVTIVVQPHTLGNTSAGRTELDGRIGFCYGSFIKRFCTVAWAFVGLFCIAMFPNLDHPEEAFGKAVSTLLPAGLRGVMLASILGAVMSTCDSLMIAASGLFTQNVYRSHLVPGRSETHYVGVARVVSVLVVVGGVGFSLFFTSVIHGLEFFWRIAAFMGISFWLGLLWRRMNRYGALGSFVVAVVVAYGTHRLGLSLPYQMLGYLALGSAAGILISLCTRSEDENRLDELFKTIHTPIAQEDQLHKPYAEAVPQARKLIRSRHWEILKPAKVTWLGFVVAWGVVILLIAGTVLLVRVGR